MVAKEYRVPVCPCDHPTEKAHFPSNKPSRLPRSLDIGHCPGSAPDSESSTPVEAQSIHQSINPLIHQSINQSINQSQSILFLPATHLLVQHPQLAGSEKEAQKSNIFISPKALEPRRHSTRAILLLLLLLLIIVIKTSSIIQSS